MPRDNVRGVKLKRLPKTQRKFYVGPKKGLLLFNYANFDQIKNIHHTRRAAIKHLKSKVLI